MSFKRTGLWYKVRTWETASISWKQLPDGFASPEEAVAYAEKLAHVVAFDVGGSRPVQAIKLERKGKNVDLEILYDSSADPKAPSKGKKK
jgi:hypothetical protein